MNGITILVVEDNLFDFETTNRKLNYLDSSFNIIHLQDGKKAIDYLFQKGEFENSASYQKPDLVLLDIMMPLLNGLEVLKIIKEEGSPEVKNIPVIMLTSLEDDPSNKTSFLYGAKGFLLKPVRLDHLKDFIVKYGLKSYAD